MLKVSQIRAFDGRLNVNVPIVIWEGMLNTLIFLLEKPVMAVL